MRVNRIAAPKPPVEVRKIMDPKPPTDPQPVFEGFKIVAAENKEQKFLYNKLMDIVKKEKVGAVFATDYVTISSGKKSIKDKLIELAIKFIEE